MTRALLRRVDPALAAVLALGAFLCFGGLGGRGLWQDEAETVALARRVLAHGVPLADDGFNAVSAEEGRDRNARGVWDWSPWLQFYAAAASTAALGSSEAAARLPFALAGWLCLPAVFALARRWSGSVAAARLSALALVLSTPFLLHARQARWYPLAALAVAGLFLALDGVLSGRRRAIGAFAAAGLALFYANYLAAIAALAALWAAVPILRLDRPRLRRLALATGIISAGALPGLAFFHVLGKPGVGGVAQTLGQGARLSATLLAHLLPWPAAVGLLWAAGRGAWPAALSRRVLFLLAWLAASVAALAAAPWSFFRYLIPLAPVAAVLIGVALEELRRRAGPVALLAAALLATDLFALAPLGWLGAPGARWADPGPALGAVHSPWLGLIGEILRGYDSCDRAAGLYLRERAAPGDVVLANYGDLPLQLYSGLRARGGDQGPPWPESPDWAVMHPYEISRDPGRDHDVLLSFRARLARRPKDYARAPFACVDPALADAPDPDSHLFAKPAQGSSLLVFRRSPRR